MQRSGGVFEAKSEGKDTYEVLENERRNSVQLDAQRERNDERITTTSWAGVRRKKQRTRG